MESNTSICNQALGRIGAKRINDFGDTSESSTEAIQCRLHYIPTRDALQRSHFWVFNKDRLILSQHTESPSFEYDRQFLLPNDFLRYRYKFDEGSAPNQISVFSFSLETNSAGLKLLLTNETSVCLVFSRLITDPSKFDPLFVELFVLKLAKKLFTPLAGSDRTTMQEIKDDIAVLMPSVRALDRNEGAGTRQNEQQTWNDARLSASVRNRPTVASS